MRVSRTFGVREGDGFDTGEADVFGDLDAEAGETDDEDIGSGQCID
jgi:hypothetical protein